MKTTVRQIEYQNNQCRVECSTEFGAVWASWHGEPPQSGAVYNVELDLPAIASMDIRLAEANDQNPSLCMEASSSVVIVGTLIRDDAGGMSLQLGNTTILLDTLVESVKNGTVIRCTASEISMYPISL